MALRIESGKSRATKSLTRRLSLFSVRRKRKEEVTPHGVERVLRGEETDAFAVAREAPGLFAGAALVGDADVSRSDGLFRRATSRAGYAGDTDADGRARLLANAVRERQRHFRADRAF